MSSVLVAVISESRALTASNNLHRVVLSTDHGVTWSTPPFQLFSARGQVRSRLLALSSTSFLAGDVVFPPQLYYPQCGVSAMTLTADDVTWATRWTEAQANGTPSVWEVLDFADLGSGHLVAVGQFLLGNFLLLHSTDSGATWGDGKEIVDLSGHAFCALYSGTRLLVGGGSTTPVVAVSDDAGQTFAGVTLPSAGSANGTFVRALAGLGSSVVLAGGRADNVPKLWRSTNNGDTWTDISAALADGGTLDTVGGVTSIVVVGGGVVALSISGRPDSGHRYFRLSTDNGVTFPTVGTYDPTPTGTQQTTIVPGGNSGVLAEDGSVIFGVTRTPVGAVGEIWRGVITGSNVAWTRTANYSHGQISGSIMPIALVRLDAPAVVPPPPVPTVALPPGCPTLPFAPEPCEPTCPTPTTPTTATPPDVTALLPGFAAPDFVWGALLGGAPSAMGRPEGCGPFFFPDTQTQECA